MIEPVRESLRPDAPSQTSVIYHVGHFRFHGDANVISSATLSHLEDLCDSLTTSANPCRVLRIASGLSSRYAKTQVSAQLAQMLSNRGTSRALLVEGDVDAPALHRALGVNVPRSHGLSNQLQRMAETHDTAKATVLRLTETLDALVESRSATTNTLDLPQFADLLAQQRTRYDFVVVDGPVVDESWPDASHFGQEVDGVIFVALAGDRFPETLTLATKHFTRDSLVRIIKTGEPPTA